MRAWSSFQSSELAGVIDDPKVLTLKGRLLKDLARLATGEERQRLYSQASDAYLAANALEQDSYPLINAAALACFAGDHERAQTIAAQVLGLIESDPNEGETAYWREATIAEAYLLMGEVEQACAALRRAYNKLPFAHEDQAATLGQFDRIIEAQSGDPSWLEPFRVPCSVNFVSATKASPSEEISGAMSDALEDLAPGYGFCGLSGAHDLIFAEQILKCGAELSLVFTTEPQETIRTVFEPLGQDWVERFRAVVEAATQTELLPSAMSEDPLAQEVRVQVAYLVAMGHSLRRSEALRSRADCLLITDGVGSSPLSSEVWSRAGSAMRVIDVRHHNGADAATLKHGVELDGLVFAKDPEAFSRLGPFPGLTPSREGERIYWRGAIDAVATAIFDLIAPKSEAQLSFHFGHPASQKVPASLIDRMERSARAAHPAKVKTGFQSAMIAKVMRPGIRLEELGEIQTLSGQSALWSVSV